jgi:hypothetical protein
MKKLIAIFQWHPGAGIVAAFGFGLALWALAVATDPFVPLFIVAVITFALGFAWFLGWAWSREERTRDEKGRFQKSLTSWRKNLPISVVAFMAFLVLMFFMHTSYKTRWYRANHTELKVRGFRVEPLEAGKEVLIKQIYTTVGDKSVTAKFVSLMFFEPTTKDAGIGKTKDNQLFNLMYGTANVSVSFKTPNKIPGDTNGSYLNHSQEVLTDDQKIRIPKELSIYLVGADRYRDQTGCYESTFCAFSSQDDLTQLSVCAENNVNDKPIECRKGEWDEARIPRRPGS